MSTLTDHRGEPLSVGDRVVPVGWGDGVPLFLSNTRGTVVKIGRSRIHVEFDLYSYGPADRPHSAPSRHFRRIA